MSQYLVFLFLPMSLHFRFADIETRLIVDYENINYASIPVCNLKSYLFVIANKNIEASTTRRQKTVVTIGESAVYAAPVYFFASLIPVEQH